MTMTEPRAKRILGDSVIKIGLAWIGPDGRCVGWDCCKSTAYLAGRFHPLELEAIAWWVRHKAKRR